MRSQAGSDSPDGKAVWLTHSARASIVEAEKIAALNGKAVWLTHSAGAPTVSSLVGGQ
jgi:hypothetical protein